MLATLNPKHAARAERLLERLHLIASGVINPPSMPQPRSVDRPDCEQLIAAALGIKKLEDYPTESMGVVTYSDALVRFGINVEPFDDEIHDYAFGESDDAPALYHPVSKCVAAIKNGRFWWGIVPGDNWLEFSGDVYGIRIDRSEWSSLTTDPVAMKQLRHQGFQCFISGRWLTPQNATLASRLQASEKDAFQSKNLVWVTRDAKAALPAHGLADVKTYCANVSVRR